MKMDQMRLFEMMSQSLEALNNTAVAPQKEEEMVLRITAEMNLTKDKVISVFTTVLNEHEHLARVLNRAKKDPSFFQKHSFSMAEAPLFYSGVDIANIVVLGTYFARTNRQGGMGFIYKALKNTGVADESVYYILNNFKIIEERVENAGLKSAFDSLMAFFSEAPFLFHLGIQYAKYEYLLYLE